MNQEHLKYCLYVWKHNADRIQAMNEAEYYQGKLKNLRKPHGIDFHIWKEAYNLYKKNDFSLLD